MSREPIVRVLEADIGRRCLRLRLEGGALTPEWADSLRPGRTAWCEVTVYIDETPGEGYSGHVGAYGGEVWPGAWPTLFRIGPRTTHGQATYLTERGLEIALAALHGVSGAGAAYI